ncbi:Uu.00g012300.m01.CDS01 [Anthostomella pinea]|uniref:Uu.00g012300.m01.CDS01 n=1 Tax=Anthostomella pinea TaxID=933095 RepID=A0AAI8VXX2_9PEZI|nr:Uu.00g012300.m01.CDS01 [Anthostomella pinea]
MSNLLGALTTTFTPPSDCAANDYSPSVKHYYSPGICPSGYIAACTSLNSVATLTETVQYNFDCAPNSLAWQSTQAYGVNMDNGLYAFPSINPINTDGQMHIVSTARTSVGIGATGRTGKATPSMALMSQLLRLMALGHAISKLSHISDNFPDFDNQHRRTLI